MVNCPDCGAGADLTKDGEWAHCASCNNIFQPKDAEGKGKESGGNELAGAATETGTTDAGEGGKGEDKK